MNLEAIAAIIVGLIVAGLGITVKIEADALAKAHTANGVQAQQISDYRAGLQTTGASLTDALKAVDQWKTNCTANAAQLAQAQADLATVQSQLTASHAALAAAEAKDRATPACAALLGADLALVCPGVAASLRERPASPGHGH